MKKLKSAFPLLLVLVLFLLAGCQDKKETTVVTKDSTTTVNNNTQTTVVVPPVEKTTTTTTTTPAPTTTTTTTPSNTGTTTTVVVPTIGKTWTTITTQRGDIIRYIEAKKQPEAHVVVFSLRDAIRTLPSQSAGLSEEKKITLNKLVASANDLSDKVDKYLAANDFVNAKTASDQLVSLLDQIKILYPNESFK